MCPIRNKTASNCILVYSYSLISRQHTNGVDHYLTTTFHQVVVAMCVLNLNILNGWREREKQRDFKKEAGT
jgi:hypothetical protein